MPSDADALALQPYADSVSPSVATKSTVVYRGTASEAPINGVGGDYFQVHNYNTVTGSTFASDDVIDRSQVAVIDEDTRDTFFDAGDDPVGKVLLLGGVPVRVIGVVRSSGASFGPASLNVWVPYTTVMTRISGQNFLDSIEVRVSDEYDTTLAEAEINALLTTRHGTKDFFLSNSDTIRDTMTSTTRNADLAGGDDRCDLADRRRDRGDEYHAGIRHRAHKRDRRAHRDRGAAVGYRGAVPDRGRVGLPDRWRHRDRRSPDRRADGGVFFERCAVEFLGYGDCCGFPVLNPDRDHLWLFAGAGGGKARPGGSAQPRVRETG